MEKITMLRIKYLLTTASLLIVISTIFPTFMRYHINVTANAKTNGEKKETYPYTSTTKVIIKRVDGTLYIKVDDREEQELLNYSTIKNPFYAPLSIGASLDGKLKAQRYFKGTLSNIKVTLQE